MIRSIDDLLASCGLTHHADVFRAQEIDLDIVTELDDADLRELGLAMGPRRKLLRAIAEFRAGADREASSPSQAERRHLTALFSDLADSTAIGARLDPEEMSDILRRYRETCTEAIAELGGTVAKYLGDGVLAYFGYPTAHEDDPERAVDAALEITERAASWPELHGAECHVRVGIATGMVVVGETIGEQSSREQVAVGDTLNLAARLEAIAPSNGVVIADATRSLIGDRFEVIDRGFEELKGFSVPQRVWTVSSRRVRTRFRMGGNGGSPIVGRDRELGLLTARWAHVVEGGSDRVIVHGPAGIGKSRLVAELLATNPPQSVVTLQCAEPYSRTPYWPVTRWLSDLAVGRSPSMDELTDRFGLDPQRAACVLSLWLGADPGLELPANPALVRERTLSGLVQLLGAEVGRRPGLLVVEDTQWADPSTLELLERLTTTVGDRLMVIETTRRAPAQPTDGVIGLRQLAGGDLSELVDRLSADLDLGAEHRKRIGERANGVPYFVEQLVEFVRTAQPNDPEEIPDSLHDALMARLDRIPRSRDFLVAGSVVGTSFDIDLVSAAVGVSSDLVRIALDDAVTAGLVTNDPRRPNTFAFTQPLLRDSAYQSLVRDRRAGYHERIARAMVDAGRATDRPELVARHFSLAGEHRDALEHWESAANLAIARSASAEAADHLEAALEAHSGMRDGEDSVERELKLRLLLGARLLAIHGFGALDVEVVYSRALELCSEVPDGPERLAAYWGLWGFHVVRADLDEAASLAEGFMRLAHVLSHAPARVAAGYAAGVTRFYRGRLIDADATLRDALDQYDVGHRDESLVLYGLDLEVSISSYLGWVAALRGDAAAAHEWAERAIAVGNAADDPFSLAFATTFAAQTNLFLRNFGRAKELAETTREMSFEHGYAQWQGQAAIQLGHIAVSTGADVDPTPIEDGLRQYISTGATLALPYTRAWLAEALRRQGELDAAIDMVRQGLRETASSGETYFDAELLRLSAEIAVQMGDHDEAARARHRAAELAREQGAALLERRIAQAAPDRTTTGGHS